MTFEQLPIYLVVWKVYSTVDEPGSDLWISSWRTQMFGLVLNQLVNDNHESVSLSLDEVVGVWRHIRKNANEKILCQVALAHGNRCFFAGRGKGDCSNEIHLDRIVPGDRGGMYTVENCMIVCSKHNLGRSQRTIEDYLLN